MARPRKKQNRGLPPNLVYDISRNSYRYRRPDTKKYTYLGTDKLKAINAANEINALLMPDQDELVYKVLGIGMKLKQFIRSHFIPIILPERKVAETTLKEYHYMLNRICSDSCKLSYKMIDKITVRDIADFLSAFTPVPSNHYRSLLSLVFKYAIAEGHTKENPAASTMKRRVTKTRKQLTLEAYHAIYDKAEEWLKIAMDIALITLQQRSDIVNIKYTDIEGDYEYLYLIQHKTKQRGKSVRLKIQIGLWLKEVLQCSKNEIDSPFVVHRLPKTPALSKEKIHHTQVLPKYVSERFVAARDAAVNDNPRLFKGMSMLERPTFNEIRSLGIKLYEDAGIEPQKLAGHAEHKLTEHSKKSRENRWTNVEATLKINL